MRTVGGLHEQMLERENLLLAVHLAAKGRRVQPAVSRFLENQDKELARMRQELRTTEPECGQCVTFTIHDPKKREITAPVFRERVLHHAVMNVCAPALERRQIFHSYACRAGKGMHAALAAARKNAAAAPWFLKLDVRAYFASIPHERLMAALGGVFREKAVLRLLELLVKAYTPGAERGLPIGTLVSQHLANFYLTSLDTLVVQELRPLGYVRYMDDLVLCLPEAAAARHAAAELKRHAGDFGPPVQASQHPPHGPRHGLSRPPRLPAPSGTEPRQPAAVSAEGHGPVAVLGGRQMRGIHRAGPRRCPAGRHGSRRLPHLAETGDYEFGRQAAGSDRVLRGGSWYNNGQNVRSGIRNGNTPDNRNRNIGFRPSPSSSSPPERPDGTGPPSSSAAAGGRRNPKLPPSARNAGGCRTPARTAGASLFLMKNEANLSEARRRIAACLMLDAQGNLVQRQDHLNLAGLGLTTAELGEAFDPQERGLPQVSFADLVHLTYLDLTKNALTELPECVCEMTGLEWLGVNFNQVGDLPDEIGQLVKLKRLYARGNRLKTLPAGIGTLEQLEELDLNGNQIEELPGSFATLYDGKNGKVWPETDFDGNPAEFLRLYSRKDPSAFLAELIAQTKQQTEVREGKLLLVGEGEVGKSTLLRALNGECFQEGKIKQTQGVELAPLPLPLDATEPQVTLNAWDFSGQDPVRDTHQIFFTRPAIYLLVFKARTGTSVQTLIDWLWLIKHRTKSNAKVLVVGTEVGEGTAKVADIDRVWRLFGGKDSLLIEERIHYVECNEKHAGGLIGIRELRDLLLRVVKESSGFCQKVSQDMLNVRQQVEAERDKHHFMSWQAFEDLCHQNGKGLQREHVPAFARQQHEIGKLVWIERGILADTVILAPDWLGKALSYIFQPRDGGKMAVLGGIATQKEIEAEWRQPRRTGTGGQSEPPLDEDKYPTFRAFMAEYDLWHPVDPESAGENRRYLIPKLFTDDSRKWEAAWDALPPAPGNFKRQVQLNGWDGAALNTWLMRAFFSRLIVRLYPQLLDRGSASAEAHWQHGFRLREDYLGDARVWFDKDRGRVFFHAIGHKPDALWYSLRGAIDGLRQEMAAPGTELDIQLARYVPCSAAVECSFEAAEQGAFSEEKVLLLQRKNIQTTACPREDCENCELDVGLLVQGIATSAGRPFDRDKELLGAVGEIRERTRRIEDGVNRIESDLWSFWQILEATAAGFWQRMEKGMDSFQRTLEQVLKGAQANADQLAVTHMLVGEVKNELLELQDNMNDPHRLGPCLFFIEPAKPEFWKDAGDLFGKKFRLHLCCERALLPVSWFESTKSLGSYDFTMDEAWWSATKPYLKGVSRLLAAFVPGAGLLGSSADVSGLLTLSDSDIVKHGKSILENMEKMLVLPEAAAAPREAAQGKKAPHGLPELTEARDLELKQLHSFLIGQIKIPNLETANLGLLRRYDKGQKRHLWVHPSQAGKYDEPREA